MSASASAASAAAEAASPPPLKRARASAPDEDIVFSRKWCMSSADTFSIRPIKGRLSELIPKTKEGKVWIDPFARNSPFKNRCTATNDLNKEFDCTHNMDALDFLKTFADNSVDGVLYDPPYSPRQVKEMYASFGQKVTADDTKSSFYSNFKKEIARITRDGATVVCFGWNTGGIGKGLGFTIKEIMLVPHGSAKNDTIMTVCVKNGGGG